MAWHLASLLVANCPSTFVLASCFFRAYLSWYQSYSCSCTTCTKASQHGSASYDLHGQHCFCSLSAQRWRLTYTMTTCAYTTLLGNPSAAEPCDNIQDNTDVQAATLNIATTWREVSIEPWKMSKTHEGTCNKLKHTWRRLDKSWLWLLWLAKSLTLHFAINQETRTCTTVRPLINLAWVLGVWPWRVALACGIGFCFARSMRLHGLVCHVQEKNVIIGACS